jgi:hypothetical protein
VLYFFRDIRVWALCFVVFCISQDAWSADKISCKTPYGFPFQLVQVQIEDGEYELTIDYERVATPKCKHGEQQLQCKWGLFGQNGLRVRFDDKTETVSGHVWALPFREETQASCKRVNLSE